MSSVKVDESLTKITAEQAVAGLKDYSQLACDGDGVLYWVEYCPEQAGRNCLVRYTNGKAQNLTPPEFDVRSRVHEYGGLSWCLLDRQSWVFVNNQDQQLYRQYLHNEAPEQLTFLPQSRFGEPHYDPGRNRIIVIEEIHADGAVENRLVALSLVNGDTEVIHEGHDFYSSIAISPDGQQCLFSSWDHPQQPWLATRLHHCIFDSQGQVVNSRVLAGDDLDQAILQLQFDADGNIWAISDQSGWWNLCQYNHDLEKLTPYWPVEADCATAPWQFGNYQYVLAKGQVTMMCLRQASAELIQLRNGKVKCRVARGYNQFRALTAWQEHLYAVVSSAISLPQVVEINQTTGEVCELSGSEKAVVVADSSSENLLARGLASPLGNPVFSGKPPWSAGNLSLPQHVSFPVGREEAFGFFYPPVAALKEPPVVLFFHGGPTACTYPVLNPRIQYWTQRGFAVLDLNYRGSSAYGRAYRLLLHKRWGISDVEDAEAAVQYLSSKGLINSRQVFVRGSSAGGFTALAALAFSDCFSGGASLYGVTDPLALAKATHKFESHYLDWLIGSPEKEQDIYLARSPLYHVRQINVPVIFFQGEQDVVVVPEQTRAMVDALRQQQTAVEAYFYAQEGHGFRTAKNLADALEKEYHFFQRVISV